MPRARSLPEPGKPTSARFNLDRDLVLPASGVVKAAAGLCAGVSPPFLLNHAIRTYYWALLLAKVDHVGIFDRDLLCVACLLHDLGLTDRFRGSRCFEEESAAAAAEFARQHGWGRERCADLRLVIRLHMQPVVMLRDGAEAYLLSEAAACDVTGNRFKDLPRKPRDRVLGSTSRDGFREGMTRLFREEARRKPGCMADVYVREGLAERIESAPLPDEALN